MGYFNTWYLSYCWTRDSIEFSHNSRKSKQAPKSASVNNAAGVKSLWCWSPANTSPFSNSNIWRVRESRELNPQPHFQRLLMKAHWEIGLHLIAAALALYCIRATPRDGWSIYLASIQNSMQKKCFTPGWRNQGCYGCFEKGSFDSSIGIRWNIYKHKYICPIWSA